MTARVDCECLRNEITGLQMPSIEIPTGVRLTSSVADAEFAEHAVYAMPLLVVDSRGHRDLV